LHTENVANVFVDELYGPYTFQQSISFKFVRVTLKKACEGLSIELWYAFI